MVEQKEIWVFNTYKPITEIFDYIVQFIQQETTLNIILTKKPSGFIKILDKAPGKFRKVVLRIRPIRGAIKLIWIVVTKRRDQNLTYCLDVFNQIKQMLMNELGDSTQTTKSVDVASLQPVNQVNTNNPPEKRECSMCASINEPDAKFCANCGTKFES